MPAYLIHKLTQTSEIFKKIFILMQKIHSQNEHSFLVFPLCLSHKVKRNKKRLMCLRNSQMHFMTIIYVKLIICEVLMNMMHSSCKHITRNMNFIFLKCKRDLKCVSHSYLHMSMQQIKMWMPSKKKSFLLLSHILKCYSYVVVYRRDVN